jgi:hypothetical protein
MKPTAFLFVALGLLGCSSTSDLTKTDTAKTDFLVGESYRLKIGVLLIPSSGSLVPLGTFGSSTNIDEARKMLPPQGEAVVEPGTLIDIRRIITSSNPTVGKLTDVYGQIRTGALDGRVVNVRTISKADWTTGSTRRDERFLVPISRQ